MPARSNSASPSECSPDSDPPLRAQLQRYRNCETARHLTRHDRCKPVSIARPFEEIDSSTARREGMKHRQNEVNNILNRFLGRFGNPPNEKMESAGERVLLQLKRPQSMHIVESGALSPRERVGEARVRENTPKHFISPALTLALRFVPIQGREGHAWKYVALGTGAI